MKKILLPIYSLALIIFMAGLVSCGKKKSDLIVNDWKITEIDAAGVKLSGDMVSGISYSFKEDGTFEYTESGKTEVGTWTIGEDAQKISLSYEDGRKAEKQIKELSEDKAVLTGEEHGMQKSETLASAK